MAIRTVDIRNYVPKQNMTDLYWKNERRKVNDLIPFERNPRKLAPEQETKLKESIEKFNLVEIPAIDTQNRVIAGHQRLKILQLLNRGEEEIDVRVPNRPLTQEEYEEYLIRSNKNTGEWDYKILKTFDKDLLLLAGFTKIEIRERMNQPSESREDEFDVAGEYEKAFENPKTQRGEIIELGRHFLKCGDATIREDVEKLMNGAKADCIFTDPPYNVNYSYDKYEDIGQGRNTKFKDTGHIFNDNIPPEAFEEFLSKALKSCYAFTADHAPIYLCHATKTQEQFFSAFKKAGWHFSQTIIWLKERLILAMGQDYHRIYEPIMFGWKEGQKHFSNTFITNETEVWDLDRITFEEHLDVWHEKRDKSIDYRHPTQKPVRRAGRALRKSCPPEGSVLDLFAGSGSTMIAAEQLGNTAYLMELDPAYCDVIKSRWEAYQIKG